MARNGQEPDFSEILQNYAFLIRPLTPLFEPRRHVFFCEQPATLAQAGGRVRRRHWSKYPTFALIEAPLSIFCIFFPVGYRKKNAKNRKRRLARLVAFRRGFILCKKLKQLLKTGASEPPEAWDPPQRLYSSPSRPPKWSPGEGPLPSFRVLVSGKVHGIIFVKNKSGSSCGQFFLRAAFFEGKTQVRKIQDIARTLFLRAFLALAIGFQIKRTAP